MAGVKRDRKLGFGKGTMMKRWQCTLCEYVYDPALGDPTGAVAPGTAFADLPDGWVCPDCGADREYFEEIQE